MVTHKIKHSVPITVNHSSSLDYHGAILGTYIIHCTPKQVDMRFVHMYVYIEGYLIIIQPLLG